MCIAPAGCVRGRRPMCHRFRRTRRRGGLDDDDDDDELGDPRVLRALACERRAVKRRSAAPVSHETHTGWLKTLSFAGKEEDIQGQRGMVLDLDIRKMVSPRYYPSGHYISILNELLSICEGQIDFVRFGRLLIDWSAISFWVI